MVMLRRAGARVLVRWCGAELSRTVDTEGWRHELALRFQHFSNAGIVHPKPGQN